MQKGESNPNKKYIYWMKWHIWTLHCTKVSCNIIRKHVTNKIHPGFQSHWPCTCILKAVKLWQIRTQQWNLVTNHRFHFGQNHTPIHHGWGWIMVKQHGLEPFQFITNYSDQFKTCKQFWQGHNKVKKPDWFDTASHVWCNCSND